MGHNYFIVPGARGASFPRPHKDPPPIRGWEGKASPPPASGLWPSRPLLNAVRKNVYSVEIWCLNSAWLIAVHLLGGASPVSCH